MVGGLVSGARFRLLAFIVHELSQGAVFLATKAAKAGRAT